MSNDNLSPVTAPDESEAHDAARRAAQTDGSARAGKEVATRRTVGVYERPVKRARLSLPMLVILILSMLVSVIAAIRFMF
jgi:hypothetical protein